MNVWLRFAQNNDLLFCRKRLSAAICTPAIRESAGGATDSMGRLS
jgi:hypothetical protein